MKLTHLALILTLGLLCLTTWIAWSEHDRNLSTSNRLALLERHIQPDATLKAQEDQMLLEQMSKGAKSAPAPVLAPITVSPVPAPPPTSAPGSLAGSPHVSPYSLQAQPPPLTQEQRQVQAAPAIGKVSEYQPQYGFVVVTAGANRKLEKGMIFALRHNGFIVGRIKISDVDSNSAVGDLDGKSVPKGVAIMAGDDVIQDMPTGS